MIHTTTDSLLAAVDRAAGKYIPTERDDQIAVRLNRLLARNGNGQIIAAPWKDRGTGDARGLIVIEPAGGGKSTLIRNTLSNHSLLQATTSRPRPWIHVNAPSPTTTKSLGIEIVKATGYEDVSRKDSEQEIWGLAAHRLTLQGIVFVWIDEAHDLFGSKGAYEIQNVLKRLKNLMQGEGAVSVILSGIEDLWQLTAYDDQIDRRYLKLALDPISSVRNVRLLKGILHTLCAEVGMAAPHETDIVERLVYASRQRFGLFIENTLGALEAAALAGAERLNNDHFAQHWALREGPEMGRNVFLARDWTKIDLTKKSLPQRSKSVR